MIIETAVGAVAGSVALWLAYLRAKKIKHMSTTKSSSVSLEFSAEEFEILSRQAAKQGTPLKDFLQEAAFAAISPAERVREQRSADNRSPMDAAFDEADRADAFEIAVPGVFPLPPAPAAKALPMAPAAPVHKLMRQPATFRKNNIGQPQGPHPCYHLHPKIPSNFVGQCQGTCRAPTQDGRICHWPQTSAQSCPTFQPIVRVGQR